MSTSSDRREFLRRAGLGAAVAGAWVAPQVLSTPTASAACSPVEKFLQVSIGCAGVARTAPSLLGCAPTGWTTPGNDGVGFACAPAPGIAKGATITIAAGCTPLQAMAVRTCFLSSGGSPVRTCIPGTIVGQVVTFPTITDPRCFYDAYRIRLTCCL